jgi:hypothetical protein
MNIFQKLGFMIKHRTFRIPNVPGSATLPSIKTPGISRLPTLSLGQGKVKWVVFGSVGLSATVVAVGMYFAVIDVVSATYEYPQPGAEYSDLHTGGTLGQALPPDENGEESMTLKINLAADARLSTLSFTNLDLGKTSQTCVTIGRDTSNTTGYLFVEDFTMSNVSAPTLDIANAEIYTMTLAGKVDGHTWEGSLDSTITDQVVTSTRGSGSFAASDSVVDRVIINLMGNATVSSLTFSDIACGNGSTAGWDIDYVKAGTWTQDSTSRFGAGTGIDTASWVMNSTTSYAVATSALVDTPIHVR